MARERKKQGKLDIRVILDDDLSDFLRQLTKKTFRSFQEEIRFMIKQQKETSND
jgi:hypothetical protein